MFSFTFFLCTFQVSSYFIIKPFFNKLYLKGYLYLLNDTTNLVCDDPPIGKDSSWNATFTFIEGELWTESEITYTCQQFFTAVTENVLTCQSDSTWSPKHPPLCAPGCLLLSTCVNVIFIL